MTTSAMTFRNELKERLVDFVWQQWCRLGVSGASRKYTDRVIDPEVLLQFKNRLCHRGLRAVKLFRTTSDIPIAGDSQKCIAAGCDDYLTKPIDRGDLLRIFAEYLPSKKLALVGTVDSARS